MKQEVWMCSIHAKYHHMHAFQNVQYSLDEQQGGRCNLCNLNRYLTIWHCFTSLKAFIFETWGNKLCPLHWMRTEMYPVKKCHVFSVKLYKSWCWLMLLADFLTIWFLFIYLYLLSIKRSVKTEWVPLCNCPTRLFYAERLLNYKEILV